MSEQRMAAFLPAATSRALGKGWEARLSERPQNVREMFQAERQPALSFPRRQASEA